MTEQTQATVSAIPIRDFSDYDDAGNPRQYVKDKAVELPEGLVANFEACGLVKRAEQPASEGDQAPKRR